MNNYRGLLAATGEVVVIQDADLEYDPDDFPRLLAPIAAELGGSLAQLAIAWAARHPNVSTVITGASSGFGAAAALAKTRMDADFQHLSGLAALARSILTRWRVNGSDAARCAEVRRYPPTSRFSRTVIRSATRALSET